jgi:hypothetical protein
MTNYLATTFTVLTKVLLINYSIIIIGSKIKVYLVIK